MEKTRISVYIKGSFTPLDVAGNALLVLKGRKQIAHTILESTGQAVAIHHLFSYKVNVKATDRAKGVFL